MTVDRQGERPARRPPANAPSPRTRGSFGIGGISFGKLKDARDVAIYLVAYPTAYAIDQVGPVAQFFQGTPSYVVAGLGGTFVLGIVSVVDLSTKTRRRIRKAHRFERRLATEGLFDLAIAVDREATLLATQTIDWKEFDAKMKSIAKRYREGGRIPEGATRPLPDRNVTRNPVLHPIETFDLPRYRDLPPSDDLI